MQLQTSFAWLLQAGVTSIPGFIYQWLAARELEEKIGFSIVSVYKSWRYWALRLLFFALPVVMFWLVVPLLFRVEPVSLQRSLKDWTLWGLAIGFGFFFPYFLKAPISILAVGSTDAAPVYETVVGLFSKTIRRNYQHETGRFWALLGEDLRLLAARTNQRNYRNGRAHLFDRLVIPLDTSSQLHESEVAWQSGLKQRLDAINPEQCSDVEELSHETIQLLKWLIHENKITRRDLLPILRSFGCDLCIQRYFPNATGGTRPRS